MRLPSGAASRLGISAGRRPGKSRSIAAAIARACSMRRCCRCAPAVAHHARAAGPQLIALDVDGETVDVVRPPVAAEGLAGVGDGDDAAWPHQRRVVLPVALLLLVAVAAVEEQQVAAAGRGGDAGD